MTNGSPKRNTPVARGSLMISDVPAASLEPLASSDPAAMVSPSLGVVLLTGSSLRLQPSGGGTLSGTQSAVKNRLH